MTTAFVLSGGANLGAVQVGMLRALGDGGVRPDLLVGASVGAINAGWLAGATAEEGVGELAELWLSLRRGDVFPVRLGLGLAGFLGKRSSLVDAGRLQALIRSNLRFERLEDAPVPLYVVVTDVLDGSDVALCTGSAAEAIMASSAIPGVFAPVVVDGVAEFGSGGCRQPARGARPQQPSAHRRRSDRGGGRLSCAGDSLPSCVCYPRRRQACSMRRTGPSRKGGAGRPPMRSLTAGGTEMSARNSAPTSAGRARPVFGRQSVTVASGRTAPVTIDPFVMSIPVGASRLTTAPRVRVMACASPPTRPRSGPLSPYPTSASTATSTATWAAVGSATTGSPIRSAMSSWCAAAGDISAGSCPSTIVTSTPVLAR